MLLDLDKIAAEMDDNEELAPSDTRTGSLACAVPHTFEVIVRSDRHTLIVRDLVRNSAVIDARLDEKYGAEVLGGDAD